jgi:NitT/TauT family transport system ATP-binding protein
MVQPDVIEPAIAAGEGKPLIRLSGIAKRYSNGVVALSGIDLDIARGEFLSLLGPSGCGKTTLLRMIAGLTPATEGRIEGPIESPIERGAGGGEHAIGFVFQEPTLLPWATVFDNVFLPLKLAGLSRARAKERVLATLDSVGLAGFEGAYPRALSGGMKMRVSIARALVTEPRLLLMDEPFAALDEITRFKLNDDLLRLWRAQGWTVVFVTHSVFESAYLSTRIAVMGRRPGHIATEIAIDVEQTRDEAFRTSPRYGELCRSVSSALAGASA